MMGKHTPGPWVKEYDLSTHRIEVNAPDDGRCVCFIHVPPATGFDVCEANARLIAAAPELLEALKAILPVYKDWTEDGGHDPSVGIDATSDWIRIENAEAAIARAESSE